MKRFIAPVLLFASMTSAFAQHERGNGGGVHYCPDRSPKVQFYDLYEGKYARPRRPIPVFEKSLGTEVQMISDALKKLAGYNPVFAAEVKKQISFINDTANFQVVKKKLKLIPDANYLWVDEGCTYEQLANWVEPDNFLYISETFATEIEKSPLDSAAFKMHEAIYKAARLVQDQKDSDKVRELNAYLFSDADIPKDVFSFVSSINLTKEDNGDKLQIKMPWQNQKELAIHLGRPGMKVANQQLRIRVRSLERERLMKEILEINEKLSLKLSNRERIKLNDRRNEIYLKHLFSMSVNDGEIKKDPETVTYNLGELSSVKKMLKTGILVFKTQMKSESNVSPRSFTLLIEVELIEEGKVIDSASLNHNFESRNYDQDFLGNTYHNAEVNVPIHFTID